MIPYAQIVKSQQGQGGKVGHSNMAHYVTTEEIKEDRRKRRRQNDKKIIKNELEEYC